MNQSQKNRAISAVIKDYMNKKGGKVSIARKDIVRRFDYLDWKDQKKIILAMIDGSKTDREWIALKLLSVWDKDFEEKIKLVWEKHHEERIGWVVIQHASEDYVLDQIDNFTGERDYYFAMKRLGGKSNVVIDRSRLSNNDYLSLIEKCKLFLSQEDCKLLLTEIIEECCKNPYVRTIGIRRGEIFTAKHYTNVYRALCDLERIGQDGVIRNFNDWMENVRNIILSSSAYISVQASPVNDDEWRKRVTKICQDAIKKNLLCFNPQYSMQDEQSTSKDIEYSKNRIAELYKMLENNPALSELTNKLHLEVVENQE